MHKIYGFRRAGSVAPEAMFAEAGVEYKRIDVRQTLKSQEYRAINPLGQVPTLVWEDGKILTESAAMVLHIGERYPQSGLVPASGDPDRVPFLRWLFYLSTNVYARTVQRVHPDWASTDANAVDGIRQAAQRDLDGHFSVIEHVLVEGPFFLGDRYSGLDPYLWMLVHWQSDPQALFARFPCIRRLFTRVAERPAIIRVATDNGFTLKPEAAN